MSDTSTVKDSLTIQKENKMNATNSNQTTKPTVAEYPWYLKDKDGYPIEFQKGKGRIIRIICQNIRKITG